MSKEGSGGSSAPIDSHAKPAGKPMSKPAGQRKRKFRYRKKALRCTWSGLPTDTPITPILTRGVEVLLGYNPDMWYTIGAEMHENPSDASKALHLHLWAERKDGKVVEFENEHLFDLSWDGETWRACHKGTYQAEYACKDGEYLSNIVDIAERVVAYKIRAHVPTDWRITAKDLEPYPWTKRFVDLYSAGWLDCRDPESRLIEWVWSEEGDVGKSQLARYLLDVFSATQMGGAKADIACCMKMNMDNGHYPYICIFNLCRFESKVSYTGLEALKDGFIFSSKYESTGARYPMPHVIVLANAPPDPAFMEEQVKRYRVTRVPC